jgi:hypothetical protein
VADPFSACGASLSFSVRVSRPLVPKGLEGSLPAGEPRRLLPSDLIPPFKPAAARWPSPEQELEAQVRAFVVQTAQ